MKKMNIIDKPIAEKKLKERTLRKNTTKNLMNLVNQQQHSPNQSMDESEIDLALTQHYTSGRGDLNQTMKSIAKDQFDKWPESRRWLAHFCTIYPIEKYYLSLGVEKPNQTVSAVDPPVPAHSAYSTFRLSFGAVSVYCASWPQHSTLSSQLWQTRRAVRS